MRRAWWWLKDFTALVHSWFVELVRHIKYAGPNDLLVGNRLSGANLEAQLIKDYHRVEKGLALRNPRRPFGSEVEARMTALLARRDGISVTTRLRAEQALKGLRAWNELGERVDVIAPRLTSAYEGIAEDMSPEERFLVSRRSVRDFSSQRVDVGLIRRAVSIASNSPSVCNRSAGRVHIFRGKSATKILSFQNGNSGFRESVDTVAVLTVNRAYFLGGTERNQPWIDGALFAMTFVYGLHAQGLATCMLNWSVSARQSVKLRKFAGISPSEDIICMVAIGIAHPGARVARSPRTHVESLLTLHEECL